MDNNTNSTSVTGEETRGFWQSIGNWFESIGEWFSSIRNALNNMQRAIGEWFSSIGQAIGNIASSVGNVISNIFQGLFDFISNFFTNLGNTLKDIFSFLFIPSEERLTSISNTVSSKFEFIDTIKNSITGLTNMFNNIGNAPKLNINLGSTEYTEAGTYTILDLSWYAPYKNYGDLVLTGFIYIAFIWRLYITVPSLINGVSGNIFNDYSGNLQGNEKRFRRR